MVALSISLDQLERARSRYEFRALNGSITKGASNIYGALGEVLVADYFNHRSVVDQSTYDYDLIIDGHRVDVKTKRTTVAPKQDYLCSVSAFNTGQACDYYFFVRINESKTLGYLLGYIGKQEFYRNGFMRNKGDADVNGFIFKDDCYNIKISDLCKFKPKK